MSEAAEALVAHTGKREYQGFTTREQWLEARSKTVGSSDSASLFGLSNRGPIDVYADKIGEPVEDEPSIPMRIGTAFEPVAIALVAEEMGVEPVGPVDPWSLWKHSELPLLHDSPDGFCWSEEFGLEPMEVKVLGIHRRAELEEGVPLDYQVQCQHHMLVHGTETCVFGAVVGNQHIIPVRVEAAYKLQEAITRRVDRFFEENVTKRVMPPATGSALETIKHLTRKVEKGKEIDLEEVYDSYLEAWIHAKDQEKSAKAAAQEMEAWFRHRMGDATIGHLPSGRMVTLNETVTKVPAQVARINRFRTLRWKKEQA